MRMRMGNGNELTILKSGSTHYCEAAREDDDIIKTVNEILKLEMRL